MFSNHQKKIRTIALTTICFSALSTSVIAAEGAGIDGLPPQPTQLTIPENENQMAPPSATQAVPAKMLEAQNQAVAQPSDPLNDLQPEPPVAQAAPAQPVPVPYSGTYYDSDSIGPSSLGASAGPRKVDPLYEPGSSFVVVKKDASSSSRQAGIVSAQRALKLGRYSAALEMYESLYKKNRGNKQILMGLAVAQQYNGFNESAMATYEELLKIDPDNAGATVNMMGLMEKVNPELALNKLNKLWNKNPSNATVAAQLGLLNAKLGNYEDSSRYLGIASSIEPDNALHYYNLAIVFDQAKSKTSAIEYYQKALEVDIAHNGGNAIPRDQVYDRLAELRRL